LLEGASTKDLIKVLLQKSNTQLLLTVTRAHFQKSKTSSAPEGPVSGN